MTTTSRVSVLGIVFAISLCGLGAAATLKAQTGTQQPIIIDDGDAGYAPGRFAKTTHAPAYGGDASYYRNSPGVTSAATWFFSNLGMGSYDVYATWAPTAGFSTARYTVTSATDGSTGKVVDQKAAPTTMTHLGYKWEKIGSITLTAKGTIVVSVSPTDSGYAQADAAMVIPVSTPTSTPANAPVPAQPTHTCGNGIIEGREQCDDGNNVNTDGCTNACLLPRCGDGIIQGTEECDDGNTSNIDACTNACKLPRCGDGIVQMNEYCDDGNTVGGDGCSAQCVTEAPAGADTQSLTSITLSCEGLVPYSTVRYAKNHANCVSLKKADGTFANAIQFFCDGTNPSTAITKKVDMRQGLTLSTGDTVRLCHPMIMAPWGCSPEVTVTGTSCTAAPVCGNGVLEAGEQCDDGNQSNTDGCLNTCKHATCGDGFHRAGYEGCDDGNRDDTDFCSNTCVPQRCGDGIVQGNRGEQCDDANQNNGDACTNECKAAVCGDGHVRIGVEFCDDGNTINGDGCSSTCHTETIHVCGDGIKTGTEQCDDGNTINGDGCSSTCFLQEIIPAGCGNGVVEPGERCDNGSRNGPSPLQCSTSCRWTMLNVCGNGIREGTEQCDDGNTIDTDSCTNNCRMGGTCGNGVLDPGEECDDGNTVDNDACTAQCKNAVCGDTIVWAGREQCDDGNQNDADACKNDCTVRGSTTVPTPAPVPVVPPSCGNWIFDAGEQCDMGGITTPIPNNATLCCTAACRVESCGASTPTPPTPPAPTPSNAPLAIRNVTLPELSRGIVLHGQVVALRFTATTGNKAVTIGRLQFKALQGNLQSGFALASLWEDTDNDGIGDGQDGRAWQSTMQNGKFFFGGPVMIPANSTRTFDVLISAEDYSLQDGVTRTPQLGPVQIDFDTASADYVTATATVGNATSILSNVATNGSCAAANCHIAVFTGPTPTLTYRDAGNLTITGEQISLPANLAGGAQSPVLLRLKMRMSHHENGKLYILPFAVQGAQAIESLSITVNGITIPNAMLATDCRFQAPYSRLELETAGFWQRLGLMATMGTRSEYCTYIEIPAMLRRDADTIVDVRANVKPRSNAWQNGTKVRVSLITDEHYFYAIGETSRAPLRPANSAATGGNVTYSGVLSSNEHTAVYP